MTQCPNCSQSIAVTEDHFGTLYRCEHCQAEFFIGFDGAPENSKEPMLGENVSLEESQLAVNVILPDQPMTLKNMVNENSESDPYAHPSSGNSNDIFNIDSNQNSAQPQDTDPAPSKPSNPMSQPPTGAFKEFTKDVRDFGNDVGTAGILSFDIEISGIDLAEIKRDLLEALDDKRFGWNLPELSQKIKDGTLILKNISAPKIIVLVKRITPLGLGLNWRHHVSTQ